MDHLWYFVSCRRGPTFLGLKNKESFTGKVLALKKCSETCLMASQRGNCAPSSVVASVMTQMTSQEDEEEQGVRKSSG